MSYLYCSINYSSDDDVHYTLTGSKQSIIDELGFDPFEDFEVKEGDDVSMRFGMKDGEKTKETLLIEKMPD